ncbi:MAG: 50S ribosomal protein L6 [Candidatus Pacebacteria bacterium]|nr:50S ribosomal protein L6 [Candidatus Paceibacterota bacterium]
MSRIGKQPVIIPEKTEVKIVDGVVSVKGPLGELSRPLHKAVSVAVKEGEVVVSPVNDSKAATALWGTFASHIKNMVAGVNQPFEKKLILEGVGYRVSLSGKNLELIVGFSHPVILEVPEGLTVVVEKNTISVSGSDKEKVGKFAAEIRAVKKPEPYKGKGIRYEGEVVRRKQGKKTVG